MLNRSGVNSSSDIPATPGVELGPKYEGEHGGDWPYREAAGAIDHNEAERFERCTCCGAPLPQPYGEALEGNFEDYGYLHGTRFLG